MRSFTHLMPGETQGCVGCHEPRGTRPPERLIVDTMTHSPQDLVPPEWGVTGFNYASIVQPVLDKHCVECHNPLEAHKHQGLDLTGDATAFFNVSYEHLARKDQGRTGSPWVSWIPTYNGHEWNIAEIRPKQWGSPASELADLLLTDHPDVDHKPRIHLSDAERRRLLMWMDLNVPYYGTADTAHPDRAACRQLNPDGLRQVMSDVYARRCNDCHTERQVVIQRPWHPLGRRERLGEVGLRIQNPHLNAFLLAPLAESEGGTQRCGSAVFATKEDPDYRAVLATFAPIHNLISTNPRMDMPGAQAASCCSAPGGQLAGH
jgi:mono/diheme cytochrome c family protein